MNKWWLEEAFETSESNPLVVQYQLHDLPARERQILGRLKMLVSECGREILEKVKDGLVVEKTGEGRVAWADLAFLVGSLKAQNVQKLLTQEYKINEKTGEPYPYNNSFRFTRHEPVGKEGEVFRVASRIAGLPADEQITESEKPPLSKIPALFFQQLLASYIGSKVLSPLPRLLKAGVGQETAQEVLSYLGQLHSRRVKGKVAFPTVVSRDPETRRKEYEEALAELVRDLRPLEKGLARDINPRKYSADDPRGDRLVVTDERWLRFLRPYAPSMFHPLFVTSDAVRIFEARYSFAAGVSKSDRHRGRLEPREQVFKTRPERVQQKGSTQLRQWYAALPVLDSADPVIAEIMQKKNSVGGRGLKLQFEPLPLAGPKPTKLRKNDMLVPLSGDAGRLARVLHREDLKIAWSRLVKKDEEWYLQFSLRVPIPPMCEFCSVMGIAFGLDAAAAWTVVDLEGQVVQSGALTPNRQILLFLEEKRKLEKKQKRGQWVGGRGFRPKLKDTAHEVVNELVGVARSYPAVLAIEKITYVQKQSRNSALNLLFAAWNYGQLRRFLDYKSPLAGLGEPVFVSGYDVKEAFPKDQPPTPAQKSQAVALLGLTAWQKRLEKMKKT